MKIFLPIILGFSILCQAIQNRRFEHRLKVLESRSETNSLTNKLVGTNAYEHEIIAWKELGQHYTNYFTNKMVVRTNAVTGTNTQWLIITNDWESKQTNFMSYTGEVVRIGEDRPDRPWQHSVAFYHFTDEQWRLLTNYYGISTNWMDTGAIKTDFYGPTNRIPTKP